VFLLFMVPLPGFILDGLTGPLKYMISDFVEIILYTVGYPIAQSGVVLYIGPYQLLVADACSGLNSMYSLSALGLLYVHLVQHQNKWRIALLMLSILPIAILCNVLRIIGLVLLTYYSGYEVGQGFFHEFTGVILFGVAILLLLAFDMLLGIRKWRSGKESLHALA
jgi:exosortase